MSDSDIPERTPTPPPGPTPTSAPGPTPPPPPAAATSVSAPSVTATTGKADITKRLVAFIIDGILAGILTSVIPILGGLLGGAYMLLRDGFEFDFMRYRSLGKRLMGLRAVPVDGSAMTMATSIRRNWPFAFGILMVVPVLGWILAAVIAPILGIIEAVLVLTDDQGRRYGDRFANTKVIESKD